MRLLTSIKLFVATTSLAAAGEPAKTIKPTMRLGSLSLVHAGMATMEFSPDGKRMATIGRREVVVWDVASGEEQFRIDIRPGDLLSVHEMFFLSNTEILIADGRTSCSINLETKEERWRHDFHTLALSADKKSLLTTTGKGQLAVLSLADRKQVGKTISVELPKSKLPKFELPGSEFPRLRALSHDGAMLVVVEKDGSLSFHDVRTGKLLGQKPSELDKKGRKDSVLGVHFMRDGNVFIALSSGEAKVLNPRTFEEELKFKFDAPVALSLAAIGRRQTALFPDDSLFAVSRGVNTRVFDVASGKKVGDFPDGAKNLCASADGDLLATFSSSGAVRVWNLKTGKPLDEKIGPRMFLIHAAVSAKAKTVVGLGIDGQAVIWSLDGKVQRHFWLSDEVEERRTVTRGQVGQGRNKIGVCLDEFVHLWDIDKQAWHDKIFLGKRVIVGSFALSADDETLAVAVVPFGTARNRVRVFREGKEIRSIPGGDGYTPPGLELSPDGKRLAMLTFDEVSLWDLDTGEKLASLTDRRTMPRRVHFSQDGAFLHFEAGLDENVNLGEMDGRTGKHIRTIAKGHFGIICLATSPRGKFLATGDMLGTIHLLNLETGKRAFTLEGHRGMVNSLSFNAALGVLISSSDDTTALVWDMKALGVK